MGAEAVSEHPVVALCKSANGGQTLAGMRAARALLVAWEALGAECDGHIPSAWTGCPACSARDRILSIAEGRDV